MASAITAAVILVLAGIVVWKRLFRKGALHKHCAGCPSCGCGSCGCR
ncbi:MAG: hypothetical protein II909_04370 [Kiritimatiellae bacterium]|nr:hypothetical protein [Kiritimatiellia bacterium]